MSRFVKISSLCPSLQTVDPGLDYNNVVVKMIDHWNNQFSQVLPDKPDLIITHEACDCPLSYPSEKKAEYYKVRSNKVRDFMRSTAAENNCYIAYSAIRVEPNGNWKNSTQIIDRNGNIAGIYDKNHLVIEENTEENIFYGKKAPLIKCDFGTVGCAICFDLNFEELRSEYAKSKPDLIIFSSMYHGGLMQNYWAYSCRTHFVGSIAGLQGTVISPIGKMIASSTNYHKYVTEEINLDCKVIHLDFNFKKLKDAKNKYGSKFKVYDPGNLGAVLISNESHDISINDIVKEFDFELLDDYFNRSLAHRHNNIDT